ncbi:MAG: Uma2 family endonuclease [Gemmataceae bacterium]
MSRPPRPAAPSPVVYPDSDGKPMADNTKQFRWIQTIEGNLEALYRDRQDVFVAGDNLWYPVEGHPEIRTAPDVYVVFGRPKGDRGSYIQHLEGGVPLTVVFEILSPGNTRLEVDEKLTFYDDYGAEEYYKYDPDRDKLTAYQRGRAALRKLRVGESFVSPRLGIRFDLSGPEMVVYHPDGKRFLTFEELEADREQQRKGRIAAEQATKLARQQADLLTKQLARLAELSHKVRFGQATAAELHELEQIEAALPPP